MEFLTDYTYRKKITLTGETGAGTDYQIILNVGESSGTTGDDFHIENNSQDFPTDIDEGGDLAFTSDDGETELDFWVEEVSGTTPNRLAKVWVKVSDDLGSNQDIYIYYGNSSAINKSNGSNTFLYYNNYSTDPGITPYDIDNDGFNEKFDIGASFTSGTKMAIDYKFNSYIVNPETFSTIGWLGFHNGTDNGGLLWTSADTDTGSTPPYIWVDGGTIYQYNENQEYDLSFRRDGVDLKLYLDGSLVDSSSGGNTNSSDRIYFDVYGGGGADGNVEYDSANNRIQINNTRDGANQCISYIDNLRVRKYQTTEPDFSIAGSEEEDTAPPPSSLPYNKIKPINVATETGTPTIDKAVPLKITDGDDSTTGTGDIVLDWDNISSKDDIAVYDENDTLLDYYFEKFDTTNKEAVIWVYRSWDRDGTEQLRIAYGNGTSDQSVIASDVFDNETDLQAGYLFNESSGDLLDVTSNNNDGIVNGATQGVDGIVGDAYYFNGTDDYVDLSLDTPNNIMNFSGNVDFSVSVWFKTSAITDKRIITSDLSTGFYIRLDNGGLEIEGGIVFKIDDGVNDAYFATTSAYNDGNWHKATLVVDSVNGLLIGYIDGNQVNSMAQSVGDLSDTVIIGAQLNGTFINGSYFDGNIDNCNILAKKLSLDEISADYDATKTTPTFFTQEAGEEQVIKNNALFFAINF